MTKPESRLVRIFISSTFRDFMEERDLLPLGVIVQAFGQIP